MAGDRGAATVGFGKGGLVVEQVDAAQLFGNGGMICRVGDIGIRAWRSSRRGELGLCECAPVFGCPSVALLDASDGVVRDAEVVNHIAADVGQGGHFLKQIAARGNAVAQRNRRDAQVSVVHHEGGAVGRYGVENNLKGHAVDKEGQLLLHHLFKAIGGIYVEVLRSPVECQRRDETNQSEAVVAVQVGDEDMVHGGVFQVGALHLQLCSFAAIYQV